MLHPTLALPVANDHIEDLQREAARSHTSRRTRRVGHEPHARAGVLRFKNWKMGVPFAFGQIRVSTRLSGHGVLLHERSDGDSQDQRPL
jgi:hypothetical protein